MGFQKGSCHCGITFFISFSSLPLIIIVLKQLLLFLAYEFFFKDFLHLVKTQKARDFAVWVYRIFNWCIKIQFSANMDNLEKDENDVCWMYEHFWLSAFTHLLSGWKYVFI